MPNRAPEVLTLHLKRFQQDMRGRLRKISGSIPFPADLDITPFCDPKVTQLIVLLACRKASRL